jgi:hypothetical protein
VTIAIHRAGRERATWETSAPPGTALEISFDDGLTWLPLQYDTEGWFLYISGPLAPEVSGDVTLPSGLHTALIRHTSTLSILIREAGAVIVQAECDPWPVDWGCNPNADSLDPAVRYRSELFAANTLRSLTLGQVGGCPVTVRPCSAGCDQGLHQIRGTFVPHINMAGVWVNTVCGCGNSSPCSCGALQEVVLPGPVGYVDEVRIDGVVLDPSAYRVDNLNRLVRTDGAAWPSCQDMAAPLTEDGTFGITYLNSIPVGVTGAYVAGVLATEYAAACSGKTCRLPKGVTQIVRQGITMEVRIDMFEDGLTGIREVDAYTAKWNPNRLRTRPTVYSPDLRETRQTTWSP